MKKNSKVKKVFLCALSVVLSVSTLNAGVPMSGSSVSAAEETAKSVSYAEKKVLCEVNYDSAAPVDITDGDAVWDAQNALKESSLNIFPAADPLEEEGVSLVYQKQCYDYGAVYLGADYATLSNVKSQALRVTPGATYAVSFDYYMAGDTGSAPLKLALTAGNTGSDSTITCLTDGAVQLLDIAANTDLTMAEWITMNTSITIPTDIDTDVCPYLLLYVVFDSNKGRIYFDNIKVTEASVITADLLADTDFSDANVSIDDMYKHSLAFRPAADPLDKTNTVLARISGYDWGDAVYLGMDYKDDTDLAAIEREAIKVEAGKTYTVQFTYYYDCTEFGKESPVYLTAGKTAMREAYTSEWDMYEIVHDETVRTEAFITQANEKADGWITVTKSIAFPEDYDTEAYPYLMLCNYANVETCKIYIDNIRVMEPVSSKALQVYDRQLSSNDYQDANVDADDMYNHSLAFRSAADPLDETNTVLARVSGYDYGSAVYLGMDYKDDKTFDAIEREAIKVEAGKTYTVRFAYYYDCTEFGKESPVYLTAGKTAVRDANSYPWLEKYEIVCDNDIAVEAFTTQAYEKADGWITVTKSITFPENYDTEEYPYLMLYNNSQSQYCKLYIDDVEVENSAPLAVNYTIDNESSCRIFDSGVMDYAAFHHEGKAVVWYSDRSCTKPFQYSGREKSEELEIYELYGIYEDATSVLIKGDVDLNHTVDAEDVTAMRGWLTGSEMQFVAVRADFNCDNRADIKDLVRLKKFLTNGKTEDFTVNGNPLANYTIVTPTSAGYDYGIVTSRINDLADAIKTANNRVNVDVIKEDYQPATEYEIIIGSAARNGVTTGLAESAYIVAVSGKKLYVNGGSENALGAALEALMSRIRMGNAIDEENFIEFAYILDSPDARLVNPELTVLTEDFDTDVDRGAMRHSGNNPYINFFGKDPYDFYTDIRTTSGTWNSAFSSQNIFASNGKLVLDASGLQEITFTQDGVADTRNAYIGAEQRGKFFTYGYAEIYAKLDVCSGVCPAFWLLGGVDGTEQSYYEIDVFECLGAASRENGMIKSSIIKHEKTDAGSKSTELRAAYEVKTENGYEVLGTDTGNWDKCYFNGFGNDGKFHKYAVEWTEDYIYFLYDDVRVMRMKLEEGECSGAMCPILTMYSGVNVKDWKYETGSPEEVTEDEWENSSSFEIEYMKIYSKQFQEE